RCSRRSSTSCPRRSRSSPPGPGPPPPDPPAGAHRSNLATAGPDSTSARPVRYAGRRMSRPTETAAVDRECMTRAIAAATQVRCITSPNPWVGAVLRAEDGTMFEGATLEPGKSHAEVVALDAAGDAARGGTLY